MNVRFKWTTIAILLILITAAYLRLFKIDGYMTFLGDEGRDVLIVKRMIVDHKFTLLGPTASVGGFFLGPIYYYFMLPFLWLWNLNPVGPAVMVAIFGTATTYLVYIFGSWMFGSLAGVISASFYAISPVVITYSRSSWNPNVVPFFALILMMMLWKASQTKKVMYAFYAGIALGIGIQLHYLFSFLFVATAVWLLLIRKKIIIWKTLLYLLIGIIVGALPFIAFELRHNLTNTRSIISFLLTGDETGFAQNYFVIIVDVINRLFGRLLLRLPGPDTWEHLPYWYVLTVRSCTIGVLIGAVYFSLKKIKEHAIHLILIWLLIPVLLFGFYHKGIYDYYFGIFFPLPFLLIGYMLSQMIQSKKLYVLGICVWVCLVVFNWQGRPFVHPPNNQLAQVRAIAQKVYEQTDNEPFNFALVTSGNSDHAYRYFFEIWGNPPVTIENTDNDPARKTVTKQLLVICEDTSCKPLGHPLWEIAGFGRAEIVGEWDVPFVKIYKLIHYEENNE